MSDLEPVISYAGHCPVCDSETVFTAEHTWYRDHLFCAKCGSIPRERALALSLRRRFPDWRSFSIHEAAPAGRFLSTAVLNAAQNYVATHFHPNRPLGKMIEGFRNENLEAQTFFDESFDLVVSLDVLEHVNKPEHAVAEIYRTLKPGGAHLFTAPTYKELVVSERRARYKQDGEIEHLSEAEYHGNPVSEAGSLVTFHYGYDLMELIHKWSGSDMEVIRFHDHRHGIIGDFTEVYIATRPQAVSVPAMPRKKSTAAIDRMCENAAAGFGVEGMVHEEDMIFQFLLNNPVFPAPFEAVNYYFSDGANSAEKIVRYLRETAENCDSTMFVLEFASGYGAVTRHLAKLLPEERFHACDIHPAAVEFLSSKIRVVALQSSSEPKDLVLPASYDFVFALSFFSHMPDATWGDWLERLFASLNVGGVLLFTTHGLESMKYFPHAVLDDRGYWFEASSEQKDLDTMQYGQTIALEGYVRGQISRLSGAELFIYQKAGWWGHQDLYLVRRSC